MGPWVQRTAKPISGSFGTVSRCHSRPHLPLWIYSGMPCPSLPFPSFPFLSFPFLSFPFLSFPFLSLRVHQQWMFSSSAPTPWSMCLLLKCSSGLLSSSLSTYRGYVDPLTFLFHCYTSAVGYSLPSTATPPVQARFVLEGEGPLLPALEALRASLGLEAVLHLVPSLKLLGPSLLRHADVAIVPMVSRPSHEQQHAAEAAFLQPMAAAVPVVTFATPFAKVRRH